MPLQVPFRRPCILNGFPAALLVCASAEVAGANSQTDDAKAKYENKFGEVLQDGFVLGYCSGTKFQGLDVESQSRRSPVGVGVDEKKGKIRISNIFGCPTQPLRKGEIIHVESVRTAKDGKTVSLESVSVPHSLTRGVGAFEHQSIEIGKVTLIFLSDGNADGLISKWLKISDTVESDKLGNTASIVTVKQIKSRPKCSSYATKSINMQAS